jgi:hypothetical protein
MAADGNEPQSYGSGEDWVSGETGGEVNTPKSSPAPEHREFYDARRESEDSAPHQGGHTSDVQLADCDHDDCNQADATETDRQPVTKVTSQTGGAKHDSFFRKRDYP